MNIGNSWKIESDSMNVILYKKMRRVRRADQKTYSEWEVMGYFATVKNALHELVNQKVRDTELTDLQRIHTAIEGLHHQIEALPQSPRAMPGAG